MKKILFGTTALLAAGAFVSTAQASDPIKLQLGGYMEFWMAGASQDSALSRSVGVGGSGNGGWNNFDVQGEGEVWFMGQTTLDNGMNIAVRVELENGSNDNGTDIIDEVYMTLSGKYGQAIIGDTNDVAYKSHVGAPEASYFGVGIDESDTDKFLLIPGTSNGATKFYYIEPVQSTMSGDSSKVSYFTPKLYGFQAGVSYGASGTTTGDDGSSTSESIAKANSAFDDAWAFSLGYGNTIGGVGVNAVATYSLLDDPLSKGDGVQDIAGGLSLSYMGFTLGGSINRIIADSYSTAAGYDGYAYDVGLMYGEGPYAVSFSYTRSEARGTVKVAGNDTIDLYKLGAKYALGPGVDLFGQLAYLDAKDETGVAANGNEGAIGGAVGLRLNF